MMDKARLFIECGGDVRVVSEYLGVSIKHIKAQGYKAKPREPAPKPSPFSLSKPARKLARALDAEGLSRDRIALLFGVSPSNIRTVARTDNWPIHPKAAKQQRAKEIMNGLDIKDAIRRYESGEGLITLAKDYGLSPHTLKKLLKDKVELRSIAEANMVNVFKRKPIGCNYTVQDCRNLTHLIWNHYHHLIEPNGRPRLRNVWSLDHMYSINQARLDGASIWEVCHPANLQIVTLSYNSRKNAKCDLTRELLAEWIEEWNEQYLDPYFIISDSSVRLFEKRHGEPKWRSQLSRPALVAA